MEHIVLVDDEASILTSVKMALEAEGFRVSTYTNGQDALAGIPTLSADLGVFDIKMPRMDGLELLRRLRAFSAMPVIFLTSKDDEIDEFFGLRMGADDYITKPFSQRLLIEHIRAVLRRTNARRGDTPSLKASDVSADKASDRYFQRGRLVVDAERHETLWDGAPVNLTVTEFSLLEALAIRPGVVKSRDALMDAAYDEQIYVDDRTIDSHIKRLRRKFKAVDPQFDAIETLYGVGYRYRET